MAQLVQVDKKIVMGKWDITKFQLLTYCYLNRIHISQHDLSCLTLLALSDTITLENFCSLSKEKGIFSSNQSARNSLTKAQKKGLVVREKLNRKQICINPDIKIQINGNIIINYKIVYLEKTLEPA